MITCFARCAFERLLAKRVFRRKRWRFLPCELQPLESRRLLTTAVVNVNATSSVHAIDPNIYGAAFATQSQMSDLNLAINRSGGNTTNTYNWQQDASNHANDYFFESIADGTGNGQSMDDFVTQTKNGGGQPDLTIPIVPYVASLGTNRSILGSYPTSVYGAQQATDPYRPQFGNGVTTGGQNITDTNPLYNYVANSPSFEQGWIQDLLATFGTPANGGVQYFTLGNEPALWDSTNRDIHPNGETNTELLNDIINYASMIKSIDPTAQILGPEEWGWTGYFIDGADAAAQNWGATYNGLNAQQWLLQQLAQYQAQHGVRLIDDYTLHYYPQETTNGGGAVDSDSVDQATELLRNQVTRSFWDPNYVDPSWIGGTGINGGKIDLIPMMQNWVDTYYPGTKTGITEYRMGAEGDMNGATAQADVYGIFGQQGLNLATRWTTPATNSPTYLAMKLWRNYDGNDSGFGDTSVGASVANPDQTDAFSAIRSSDGALTVAVINKNLYDAANPNATTTITINLSNFANAGVAQEWQLAAINPSNQTSAAISHLSDVHFSGNTITVTVPMESVSMFVIQPSAAQPMVTANPANLTVNASQTASFTAAASSSIPETVQWEKSTDGGATFTNVSGATSTTLSFTATSGQDGTEFRAAFTNANGTVRTTAATLTVNAPKIAVKNGTTVINDGTSTIDFGSTSLNSPVSQSITVKNEGDAPLIVQPVTVPSGYSVTGNFTANQTIAAGSSVTLTIKMNATAVGTYSGNVSFSENDSSVANPFKFSVTGAVVAPKIVVKTGSSLLTNGSSTVNFTPGTTARVITVSNTGNSALIVQPVTVPTGFTVIGNFTVNQSIAAGSNASFTIQLNANAPGSAAGVVTIPDNDTTASPFKFNVAVSPNHAPVGTTITQAMIENVAYLFKATDFGFTDPNDTPANTLLAVKFPLLGNAGTITDNGTAVTANQLVSVTDINSGKLVFSPAMNLLGGPYFVCKFQVEDNGGTANGGSNLDVTAKIFDAKLITANHAPLGTQGTVVTGVNVAYALKAADFGFTDPADHPANTLAGVKFTLFGTAGKLTDNGTAVLANQLVPVADINAGKLIFTPESNLQGGPFFVCKFQVEDNGGTASGGSNLDPTARNLYVTLVHVNHAPVGTQGTVTMSQNTTYKFKTSDFGFTDPNDSPPNSLMGVMFTLLPSAGTLTDNGVAITVNQLVSAADITSGKLSFTPKANLVGGPLFLCKFAVEDNGGTANGGKNLDTTPRLMYFNSTR